MTTTTAAGERTVARAASGSVVGPDYPACIGPFEPDLTEVEALGEAIDTIVQVETAIRRLTAFRTVLVDAARRQVPAAETALLSPASDAARGPLLAARAELAERAFVADLATALLLPERTTRALVEDAHALVHDLPATLEALGSGSISYRHAQVVSEHTAGLEPDAVHAVEAAGLTRAHVTTPTCLARHLRRARERVHPEAPTERHRRAAVDRRVGLDPAPDGMSWLTAFLPAATGHAVMDRLDHAAGTLAVRGEERTPDQLRADVLAALLLDDADGTASAALASVAPTGVAPTAPRRRPTPGRPQSGSAPREAEEEKSDEDGPPPSGDPTTAGLARLARSLVPRVHVTVPAMTLLGRSEEPGDLDGYGPIDADTARQLAASAPSFTRILTHPHTGAVLSVGRDSYAVPTDLRRHLAVRDATCRFPGCGRRAARCDVDHVVAFVDGGSTDADNLVHLCRHHHRLKHETSWRPAPSRDPDTPPGSLTWTSPTGRTHVSVPATAAPRAAIADPPPF